MEDSNNRKSFLLFVVPSFFWATNYLLCVIFLAITYPSKFFLNSSILFSIMATLCCLKQARKAFSNFLSNVDVKWYVPDWFFHSMILEIVERNSWHHLFEHNNCVLKTFNWFYGFTTKGLAILKFWKRCCLKIHY